MPSPESLDESCNAVFFASGPSRPVGRVGPAPADSKPWEILGAGLRPTTRSLLARPLNRRDCFRFPYCVLLGQVGR